MLAYLCDRPIPKCHQDEGAQQLCQELPGVEVAQDHPRVGVAELGEGSHGAQVAAELFDQIPFPINWLQLMSTVPKSLLNRGVAKVLV